MRSFVLTVVIEAIVGSTSYDDSGDLKMFEGSATLMISYIPSMFMLHLLADLGFFYWWRKIFDGAPSTFMLSIKCGFSRSNP